MNLSEEERQKRSERALALHEQGRFGGPQPGSGRPRKKRASEIVAEQVSTEGQAIFDRLMTILRDGTDSNSISAASKLLEIEKQETDRLEREDEKIENMHRDQLLLLVATQFKELHDRGLIGTDIIDGQFVEIDDERTSGTRQITASSEEN